VSATYAIPKDPSSFLTAQISGEALEGQPGEGSAGASISLDLQLYTLGPTRTGNADLFILAEHGPMPSGGGHVSSFVGPYFVPFCPSDLTCGIGNQTLPFQLGTSFDIQLNGEGEFIGSSSPTFFGGQFFIVEVRLALRESNGLPVQIYEVPEPAFLSASGFGLLGLLLFRRAKRLH
jgi:hypothetical protein